MFVVTADQKASRTHEDGVPAVLDALARHHPAGPVRPFERTAGDEIQALFDSPEPVVDALVELLRTGQWWVGVGVGEVGRPLPATARAGRGPAYLAAREAVESAKSATAGICVAGPPGAERAETVAWLVAALVSRRTPQGWEVVDLMEQGAKQVDAATKLGVSPQAVSRRLRVAGWLEERRGRDLLAWLLAQADAGGGAPPAAVRRPEGERR